MYVCVCNRITEKQIKENLNGETASLSCLRKKLGVGAECGSCIPVALELLEEKQVEAALIS